MTDNCPHCDMLVECDATGAYRCAAGHVYTIWFPVRLRPLSLRLIEIGLLGAVLALAAIVASSLLNIAPLADLLIGALYYGVMRHKWLSSALQTPQTKETSLHG